MTFVRDFVQPESSGVCVADTFAGLSEILRPECAAAIWWRPALSGVQPWLASLTVEELPRTRMIVGSDGVSEAVQQVFAASGSPDCAGRGLVVADIAMLSNNFAELMGAKFLRLRLDVVTTNACHKFHVDALTARLICTYKGTGTQYGFGVSGVEPEDIFTLPTDVPIVLRGTKWPEHPSAGLRHRSPPIEGTGETRLVLVLDPVTDREEQT